VGGGRVCAVSPPRATDDFVCSSAEGNQFIALRGTAEIVSAPSLSSWVHACSTQGGRVKRSSIQLHIAKLRPADAEPPGHDADRPSAMTRGPAAPVGRSKLTGPREARGGAGEKFVTGNGYIGARRNVPRCRLRWSSDGAAFHDRVAWRGGNTRTLVGHCAPVARTVARGAGRRYRVERSPRPPPPTRSCRMHRAD
jgi:hypothetical protein